MPASLVFDKLEGTSYSDTWDQRDPTTFSKRRLRTGFIKDLDPTTPLDAFRHHRGYGYAREGPFNVAAEKP